MNMEPFLDSVVSPVFDASGLGPVLGGLAVFVVAWTVFIRIVGRKE